MAEATTGNNLAGMNQGTGIISRISSSISNVRKMSADPAVQKICSFNIRCNCSLYWFNSFFYYAKI